MIKRLFFLLTFFLMTGLAVRAQEQKRPGQQPASETGEKFKVGMAGYTLPNLIWIKRWPLCNVLMFIISVSKIFICLLRVQMQKLLLFMQN